MSIYSLYFIASLVRLTLL